MRFECITVPLTECINITQGVLRGCCPDLHFLCVCVRARARARSNYCYYWWFLSTIRTLL